MIGKTLAHYEIIGLLGKGGMGEVYRARDAKLGREVAIKILPTELSSDPERIARFEREARTLASLQHPNVASIYGFEDVDGTPFLVMELVEGEDLAERLQRGALPVDEAIDIARQVAEGLEAAHAQDIVHRDLKPANIKITPTRDVKILDFGLARAYAGDPESDGTALANSPTITAAMTQAGVVLGTAAYMSPEQARGQAVDKQSDIWSFGVVLYEMLTGECPFAGETVSDSIGAILHRDPDLSRLPAVPSPIRTLLRRSFERDKRQRLRDIGDARIELDEARTSTVVAEPSGTGRGGRIGWFAAVAMALVAVILGAMFFTRSSGPALTRTTLGLPQDESIYLAGGTAWSCFQFSPDGESVVYLGGRTGDLYLRDIDSFESTKLAGTEGARLPVFSPDGRWIAYFAQSKLWKIAVSGGAPVEICDTAAGPGLAWGNGELYFCPAMGGGLWAVSENGGEVRSISSLDDVRDETSHRWPRVLPDGRHVLMTIKTASIATFDDATIALLSLDSGDVTVLFQGGTDARYVATGHLLYGRAAQLFAVPFDPKALSIRGTPTAILDDVHTSDLTGSTYYALSPQGHLAYVPVVANFWDFRLAWLHRSGRISRPEVDLPTSFDAAVSPDGNRFAAVASAANDYIWVGDLQQKTTSRLSNTPGNDRSPVWSPDGTKIVFRNDRNGSWDLYLVAADGSAPAEELLTSESDEMATTWSPDGEVLLLDRAEADGTVDLWAMNMTGDREARPFLQSPHRDTGAQFSPDGAWVAYGSNSSGEPEVYVRPYPGPGNPIRISRSGGTRPFWSPNGNSLLYRTANALMEVSVELDGGLRAGEPQELLNLGEDFTGPAVSLSPTPDGQRFLASQYNLDAEQQQIRVIFDWTAQLKRLEAGR